MGLNICWMLILARTQTASYRRVYAYFIIWCYCCCCRSEYEANDERRTVQWKCQDLARCAWDSIGWYTKLKFSTSIMLLLLLYLSTILLLSHSASVPSSTWVYFAGAVIHFEDAECSLRVYAQLNSCALSSSWSVRLSLGFISHTIFHTIYTHLLRTQTHNTANMHLPTLWRIEIQSDAVCSCWCHCFPTLSSHNYQVYIWMHSTEGIRLYLSPFSPSPAWLSVHRTSLTMRWWCGIWISMLMMAVAVENFVIISCVSCVVWSKLFAQIDGDSS